MWDDLFADLLPRVYNFFLYKGVAQEVAQDLTADNFERAWRHRCHFRPDRGTPAMWLLGIARNVWREYQRHNHRKPLTFPRESALEAPDATDPEATVVETQERERLRRLVTQLPERERELVALKYGAGLTNRQIAALVGLTESHVGTLLLRTVQRLRRSFMEDEP